MKLLKVLLTLLGLLTLTTLTSGCTKTVYVDRPVEVLVPVKCIVPKTYCNVEGTDAEVVVGLAKCIVDLKKAQKVCQ